ncbi:unnamed protein product [marine sediment metagenome]|uniref:Uncharacterized protein n=1 Tax=marine sediment metagenome TaxID=412755 RepID=X1SWV4_9ZZZZ
MKFSYKAKKHPLGRLRKHIRLKHPAKHKAIIAKAKRTAKSKHSKLDTELQYTDDMIVASLLKAGIPLQQPQGQIPQAPIVHESIVGAILTGMALASAGAVLAKDIRNVPDSKKKKAKKT